MIRIDMDPELLIPDVVVLGGRPATGMLNRGGLIEAITVLKRRISRCPSCGLPALVGRTTWPSLTWFGVDLVRPVSKPAGNCSGWRAVDCAMVLAILSPPMGEDLLP